MARHAVEQGAEQLRRAQPHVLERLIDQEFVQRELIRRNVLEASGFRLDEARQLGRIDDVRHESDAIRGGGVDRASGQQKLLRVFEAESIDP